MKRGILLRARRTSLRTVFERRDEVHTEDEVTLYVVMEPTESGSPTPDDHPGISPHRLPGQALPEALPRPCGDTKPQEEEDV